MKATRNFARAGVRDGIADARAGNAPIAAEAWARHVRWGGAADDEYTFWYYRAYALACWRRNLKTHKEEEKQTLSCEEQKSLDAFYLEEAEP